MSSVESKNEQLTQQLTNFKKENSRLSIQNRKLEQENEELRRIVDSYKQQVDSTNRRTADFHRSMEDHNSLGDPSELINELLVKDKKIE